jgi:uncharacterized protein YjbI with pentapeptide repeats
MPHFSRLSLEAQVLHLPSLSKKVWVKRGDILNAGLSAEKLLMANLRVASLVGVDLANAALKGCRIYGVSAWGVQLDSGRAS